MKIFLLMLQFFTRIPINKTIFIEEGDFPKGIIYFPIIGLIIGVLSSIIYYVATLFMENYIALIFVLLTNTLLTGALHFDGLADTCDGLFSARKKEQMLEIMRDSRIGTNGFLGLFFVLILKLAFLYSVPAHIIFPVIVLTPVMGRTVLAVLLYKSNYAREGQGLGNLFIGKTTLARTMVVVFIGLAISFIFLNYLGVFSLILLLIMGFIQRYAYIKKLGGLTGDLLGAINEISELMFLPILLIIEGLRRFM